jgi:hypothetical protein
MLPMLRVDLSPLSHGASEIATQLHTPRLRAGLKAEPYLHPDVKVWIGGDVIHIECKRVVAAGNIKNLVSSARNQLRKQIEEEPFCHRIDRVGSNSPSQFNSALHRPDCLPHLGRCTPGDQGSDPGSIRA